MSSIPDKTRDELSDRLWREADAIDWMRLSAVDKARKYDQWSRDPSVGGVLGHYLDLRQVRVYLKDTLMKGYTRDRTAGPERYLRIARIDTATFAVSTFIKPHGVALSDGHLLTWGRAANWKAILTASFERAYEWASYCRSTAILTNAVGRFADPGLRNMVDQAAERLGVDAVIWLDN